MTVTMDLGLYLNLYLHEFLRMYPHQDHNPFYHNIL